MSDQNLEKIELDGLAQSIKVELGRRLSPGAEVLTPSDDSWDKINVRFTSFARPIYIAGVAVSEEQDVVETVNYARSRGIPFAARGGGHCVTNSMERLKNGIVIDMRKLNKLHFDASMRQVTVGGGVATGDFATFLHQNGMEVTVGSCPSTGLFGVSFGAGIGRLQGKYGYLHDNMVSAKLILANGSVVTVSQDSNPDLFWAIRGAGHNFGIGLEATFQVYPQLNDGMHHNWDIEYDLDQVEDVFRHMNDLTPRMPPELAFFILFYSENNRLLINFIWSGPAEDAAPYIAEFEALKPVKSSGKITTTWSELPWVTFHGRNRILGNPDIWPIVPYKIFSAVSVKEYDVATCRAYCEKVVEMGRLHPGSLFGGMFETFPHQRVREIPDNATAFPWRHGTQHFLMLTAASRSPDNNAIYEEHLNEQKQEFVKTSGEATTAEGTTYTITSNLAYTIPFPYKTVLVIGATSGIGLALAEKMIGAGVHVIAAGRRQENLDAFVQTHGSTKASAIKFDITDLAGIPAFVERIKITYPTLDCVVLNSGIQRSIDFTRPESIDLSSVAKELNTNYLSYLHLTVAFLPVLQAQSTATSLVFTASALGLIPLPRCPNYSATKAALHSLTLSLRAQLSKLGEKNNVKIIEIIPPAVQTELHNAKNQPDLVDGSKIGMPLEEFTNQAWRGLEDGEEQIPVGMAKKCYERFEVTRQEMFEGLIKATM